MEKKKLKEDDFFVGDDSDVPANSDGIAHTHTHTLTPL
jgi:hypothetical protein